MGYIYCMKFLLSLGMLLSCFSYPPTLFAQADQADSSFYQSAVYSAIAFYHQSAGDQVRLFNGREYKPYRIAFISGQPFFMSEKFAAGSIIYEDVFYDNVQLLYDEVKNMIIVETGVRIEMINERIRQFSIAGHSFSRLPQDSATGHPGDGFYETLYSGKIQLYKIEKKQISEDLSDTEGVRGVVTARKYYYIRKGDQYYPVKSKNSIYDILREKRNELQQFVKRTGLSYRKDPENMLIKIAGFYEQLTK
jgi:hypothetical protein